MGLSGYGDEKTRISEGILTRIYALVLAVTDAEGNSAILMSLDLAATDNTFYNSMVEFCKTEYNIPKENVIVSSIHQHSVPVNSSEYIKYITPIAKGAITQAMNDRAPAEIYINVAQTRALNFVRHYWNAEGQMYTPNYGTVGFGLVSHESEADNEMQLLKFVRGEDKKDILITNFRAHPIMAPNTSYKSISADWPGAMREYVKEELGCNVIYFSGAGGNINSFSEIPEENALKDYSKDYKGHGKRAANFVVKAEDSYTKVEAGTVKGYQVDNEYATDHSMDHLYDIAKPIAEMYKTDFAKAKEMAAKYPEFHSVYHAKSIASKVEAAASRNLPLTVVTFGDVAFTSHAYEMFDTNGMELKYGTVGNENYAAEDQLENPFKMTIIATCSNGHNGYLPSALNCKNGGYSVDITYFAHGTAERLVADYLKILNDLHG